MIEYLHRPVVFGLFISVVILVLCGVHGQDEETTVPPAEETTAPPAVLETTTSGDGGDNGPTAVPEEPTDFPPGNVTDFENNATTVTTTPVSTTTRTPRDCVNRHPLCTFWKIHGECTKNQDFMEFFCRKTCNKCDSYPFSYNLFLPNRTEPIPCNDDNDLCVFWSKRDQCSRNFFWMLQHCPFSCGYCSTKCRPCPPPSGLPPGYVEQPKLYLGNRLLQIGDNQGVDFTNYQPDVPPEAFGLHGDPNRFGKRRKRGKALTYEPQPPSHKHHGHGSGVGWTDLPSFYGHGCKAYHPQKCATVAPLPCCIPVAVAEAQGILPLGAFVSVATPPTPPPAPLLSINGERPGEATTVPKPVLIPASPISIKPKPKTTTEPTETTSASETGGGGEGGGGGGGGENTEPPATEPPTEGTTPKESSGPPAETTLEAAPVAPTELPDRRKAKRRLRKLVD